MAHAHTEPTTAPDHIAAFAKLKDAFSAFVLVGGLEADPTHKAGSAFLTILDLETHFRRLDAGMTNAPRYHRIPCPAHEGHHNRPTLLESD